MWPGFHEPNGTGELLINQERWQQFSPALRAIITHAAAAEHAAATAEADWFNAGALNQLEQVDGVTILPWPADVLAAARDATVLVLDRLAAQGGITGEIVTSFRVARSHLARWSTVGQQAFLAARD
jgi:TRAP-type mannitol/chloroaromatic compound transport system substrate-binding protein